MDKHIKYKSKKKDERLILQTITLRWGKEMRGAPFSAARNHYEKAFKVPDTLFSYDTAYGFPYHEVLILQDKKGFELINDRSSIVEPCQRNWRVGDVEIERAESECLFTFKYSNYCGKPIRRDKFYNLLVEKAFGLRTNEYGRIIYNGRHTLQSTGQWYYELHIMNALITEDKNPNLLIDKDPLKEYKQIEVLF